MRVALGLFWLVLAWAMLISLDLALLKMGSYGLALFAFSPLVMGVLVGRLTPVETTGQALKWGAVSATIGCAFFLLLGLEGLLCTAMALPLAIPLGMLGSYLSLRMRKARLGLGSSALLILPLGVAAAGYDMTAAPATYEVSTSVEISASPQTVWQHVIAYSDMPEPTDWLFRSGISYPQRVRLDGEGVGATRYCDFSTGSFVEPITVWQPGQRLEFDVVESAAPMKEWSPYGDIQPAHLHGYFVSKKGRFVLTTLPNGHTLVNGTSWYQHGLEPAGYWRWWSDAIIHRIHLRVLHHIQQLSETADVRNRAAIHQVHPVGTGL